MQPSRGLMHAAPHDVGEARHLGLVKQDACCAGVLGEQLCQEAAVCAADVNEAAVLAPGVVAHNAGPACSHTEHITDSQHTSWCLCGPWPNCVTEVGILLLARQAAEVIVPISLGPKLAKWPGGLPRPVTMPRDCPMYGTLTTIEGIAAHKGGRI